jgi:hypothetical protein
MIATCSPRPATLGWRADPSNDAVRRQEWRRGTQSARYENSRPEPRRKSSRPALFQSGKLN